MKNLFNLLFILVLFSITPYYLTSQIDIGITSNVNNKAKISFTSLQDYNSLPFNQWSSVAFTIRYPSSLGSNIVTTITALPGANRVFGKDGVAFLDGGFYYQKFVSNTTDVTFNINSGETIEVAEITFASNAISPSVFELINNSVVNTANGTASVNHAIFGETFNTFNPSSASVVLPITIKTFEVTKFSSKSARLFWLTTLEINSDFFGIERSKDGNNWETIGRVAAAGNSSKELAYDFIDDNLPLIRTKEQVFYYRLRMTDLDGQYKYSDVRGINFGKLSEGVVTIYPNPTVEHINVDLSGMDMDAGNVDLFVYDMTGRQMIKKSIIGNGIELIDVSQLPANTYNVVVKQGDTAYQQRVIKID